MPPIIYPLPYVETTFRTREQTEGLLRPEFEQGVISHHDFTAACEFYPDPIRRRMPIVLAAVSTLSVGIYALVKRPRPSPTRLFVTGTFATIGGTVLGSYRALKAHKNFVDTLDSPRDFFQALENINARAGGKPLGIVPSSEPEGASSPFPRASNGNANVATMEEQIRQAVAARESQSRSDSPFAEDAAPEPANDGFTTADSESSPSFSTVSSKPPLPSQSPSPSSSTSTHPPSRWDAIRAANANANQGSSWDRLRAQASQSQSQSQSPSPSPSQSRSQQTPSAPGEPSFAPEGPSSSSQDFSNPTISSAELDRAREQAKFDAMLEEERRKSQVGDGALAAAEDSGTRSWKSWRA